MTSFTCFAAVCAVDYKERAIIEKLLSNLPEDRMKLWAQLQSVVPAGFLFVPGPKYNEKGLQWVLRGVWPEVLMDEGFFAL